MWTSWHWARDAGRTIAKEKFRGSLLAGVAGIVLLSAPSDAKAQCTRSYNFLAISINGDLIPQASPLVGIINTVNTAFLTNTASFVSAPGGAQPDQASGGLWARGIGGTVNTKSDSISTADFTKVTSGLFAPPFIANGALTCHQEHRQDYAGFQVGADLGKLNLGSTGVNWHFGITAGDFYARAQERTLHPAVVSSATIDTGDLKGRFEVPFIGFYNVITAGNFFTDAQLRWDSYRSTLSSAQDDYSGVHGQARGLSFTTATGYKIPITSNWFIEPSFGGVLSQTKVDPIFTPWDNGNGTTTLKIGEINSVLGRASLRVGATLEDGIYIWQPFVTATVLHEFAGRVTSTQTINAPSDPGLDKALFTTTTDRIGTYTQVGFGTAVVIGNTGWLGYGRGDVKFGENIDGWGVNFGVRRQW